MSTEAARRQPFELIGNARERQPRWLGSVCPNRATCLVATLAVLIGVVAPSVAMAEVTGVGTDITVDGIRYFCGSVSVSNISLLPLERRLSWTCAGLTTTCWLLVAAQYHLGAALSFTAVCTATNPGPLFHDGFE